MANSNCDVCDRRPWTIFVHAYGIETHVCDQCAGNTDDPYGEWEDLRPAFEEAERIAAEREVNP